MGTDEVLIWGGNFSVSGQLVPDGESRLLPTQGGAQKGNSRGSQGLSLLLPA